MTRRRPTRRTGKYAFQASAQSSSWTIRVRSSPIGPQPERLEVAERLGDLGRGGLGRGRVARGHVAADDGRPRRVDARAEPLLDEVEGRLDGRPAGRDPAEDLADRLDRLEVRLDRELQPGPGSAAVVAVGVTYRPSFSRMPPCRPTVSPASSA